MAIITKLVKTKAPSANPNGGAPSSAIPAALTRRSITVLSKQKGLKSFAAGSRATAHGTLAYHHLHAEMYGLNSPNASVESVDSGLSCHAILKVFLGSPEYMIQACAERFLGTRGQLDLEAARNASLESLWPGGTPSDVSLSQFYKQPTPPTVNPIWRRLWIASFVTMVNRITGKTAKLEQELQEQRKREFDAKFTCFEEVFRSVAELKDRALAEADARGDSRSIRSLDPTIASVASSAATAAFSYLQTRNSTETNTPPTTPEGTPEPSFQDMIEMVANTAVAAIANMAPLVVNSVSVPSVVVNDVDDHREILRQKGRGARAIGSRALEWSPSVNMCDESLLASPVTRDSRMICHGCGYNPANCKCSTHYGPPPAPKNSNIQPEQHDNRPWRPTPRFSSSSPPIPEAFRTIGSVTSNLNLLTQPQLAEAGPSCPRGGRRALGRDDKPLDREAAYEVVVGRQRHSTRPHVREAFAGQDNLEYLCPGLGKDDESDDEDETESEDEGRFWAMMQDREYEGKGKGKGRLAIFF
ncbi:hypothetical protein NDA16_000491 [Ustilago loliicola]|nr:hypothetical protein NDA16_000491 [Ustilago loliicola]